MVDPRLTFVFSLLRRSILAPKRSNGLRLAKFMARMEPMRLRLWFRRLLVVGLVCGVFGVLPWLGMRFGARSAVVKVAGAPKRNVALILGAGITADRRPSAVLQPGYWRLQE